MFVKKIKTACKKRYTAVCKKGTCTVLKNGMQFQLKKSGKSGIKSNKFFIGSKHYK